MEKKYTVRVSTGEYEYVEVESTSRDDIMEEYTAIRGMFDNNVGHNQRDWARIRNTYVKTGEITPEDVEGCSRSQRYFINEMKLVIKSEKE